MERLKQFNKRTNYFLKRTINFRNCTNDFSIIVQTVFLSYKRLKNITNDILNLTTDWKIVTNMTYEDFLNNIHCSTDNLKILQTIKSRNDFPRLIAMVTAELQISNSESRTDKYMAYYNYMSRERHANE